jgi:hypothetical protein
MTIRKNSEFSIRVTALPAPRSPVLRVAELELRDCNNFRGAYVRSFDGPDILYALAQD